MNLKYLQKKSYLYTTIFENHNIWKAKWKYVHDPYTHSFNLLPKHATGSVKDRLFSKVYPLISTITCDRFAVV